MVRRLISPTVTMPEPNPTLTRTARWSHAGEACESPVVELMGCRTYEQSPVPVSPPCLFRYLAVCESLFDRVSAHLSCTRVHERPPPVPYCWYPMLETLLAIP